MPVLRAVEESSGTELLLDTDRLVLTSSGRAVDVQFRVAAFLQLLLESSPGILTYGLIDERLLMPQEIAQPPSDTLGYIRKLKLASCKALGELLDGSNPVGTVRGVGYRLNAEWQVSTSPQRVASLLLELTNLASQCIALMRETPLLSDANEGLYLDGSSKQEELLILLNEFDVWSNTAILVFGGSGDRQVCLKLLQEMRSYITFARVGRVDSNTWRSLFETELESLVGVFSRLARSDD